MVYEGMETVVCDAEENDWLSVSYHEQKYANKPAKKTRKKQQAKLNVNKKVAVILAVAVLCVAAFAAMMFIDGGFTRDVFGAVKTAYSSVIFGSVEPQATSAQITLPCNVNLVEVSEEGVATFNGGRAVMSFTNGKVLSATEDSVVVALDDETCITYQGLTEVYVAANDEVAANALIGKYDGAFTASITVSGSIIQVVASASQLTWNV